MKKKTALKEIDFQSSVRSDEIMDNFYTIEEQLRLERLRAAGYGIIDGFKGITVDEDKMAIHIPSGRIVSKDGDIISVPETTLSIPAIIPKEVTYSNSFDQATFTVDDLGIINIKNRPYSLSKRGFIDIEYYDSHYPAVEDELLIMISGAPVKVADIHNQFLTIDARFRGKEATVSYLRGQNRVDVITVTEEGKFNIIESVIGTEGVSADRAEYKDELVVCYVKTFVGEHDELVVYDYPPYRDVRPVYVDEENRLFLNGVLYEGAFIHFEEPDVPTLHTFWYDTNTNKLFVWLETDGIEQWVAVGASIEKKVVMLKQFTPQTCPKDLQTFLIEDSELLFDPSLHQLTININNSVLMQDEFEAITEVDGKVEVGIGFKLNEPLDDPAYVEVRIERLVQTNPINTIFERVGSFVDENTYIYTTGAKDLDGKVFATTHPYRVGEHQLEVFKNGLKLSRDVDYTEAEGKKGALVSSFTLKTKAANKDKISYKITQSIFSYSHVSELVKEANDNAARAEFTAKAIEERFATFEENVAQMLDGFSKKIKALESLFTSDRKYLTEDSVLEMKNIPNSIKAHLRKNVFKSTYKATASIATDQLEANDYYMLSQEAENGEHYILREGIDFEVTAVPGQIIFMMSQEVAVRGGIIEINGIKFGREEA